MWVKEDVKQIHCCLTALCNETDAAVHYDGYVCLCQLLFAQCVTPALCCRLDGAAPASKSQPPLALNIQGPTKNNNRVLG